MPDEPLKVSLIGLGKQTQENHLPAILEARGVVLDSVCDENPQLAYKCGTDLSVPAFTSVDDLIDRRKPAFVILSVPHASYLPIIKKLASNGIHILKEKPFALSIDDAIATHEVVQDGGILLSVTLVRRFHPIYTSIAQLRNRIGSIHTIEGRYTLNIPRLDEGWRSQKTLAGGGAVLDMGYHAIDLLVWHFGLPDRIAAKVSARAREGQIYDVDDTASILFSYDQTDERAPITGNLLVSRAFPEKDERILLVGTRGSIAVKRGEIVRLDTTGLEVESLARKGTWISAVVDQIEMFAELIQNGGRVGRPLYFDHFNHIAFIDAIYQSSDANIFIDPRTLLPDFVTIEDNVD